MNAVLPGEDLIEAGVQDLRAGRETIAALLVAIGSPRLRRLGLELPEQLPKIRNTASTTCSRKTIQDSAHSRYNAFIRKLVSYERAAECVNQ